MSGTTQRQRGSMIIISSERQKDINLTKFDDVSGDESELITHTEHGGHLAPPPSTNYMTVNANNCVSPLKVDTGFHKLRLISKSKRCEQMQIRVRATMFMSPTLCTCILVNTTVLLEILGSKHLSSNWFSLLNISEAVMSFGFIWI